MSAPRIVCKPDVMLGKPCIEGTRITVQLILEELGGGTSIDDLLHEYPHITREGVLAAIRYGAMVVANELVYPLERVA